MRAPYNPSSATAFWPRCRLMSLNQLLSKLHRVSLPLRETLATPKTPIKAVYFVETG